MRLKRHKTQNKQMEDSAYDVLFLPVLIHIQYKLDEQDINENG